MSDPLTEEDIQLAFSRIVGPNLLKQLDTKLGTDDVVRWLKSYMSCVGGVSTAPDGPYSSDNNPEWWSMTYNQEKRGFDVKIRHHVRATGEDTLLREGLMRWNNIANRATIAACEARMETPPPTLEMIREAKKCGLTKEAFLRHYYEQAAEARKEAAA